jgi:hypothetical protein
METLRILLFSANPGQALSLDEEERMIRQKIRLAEHRDLVEIVTAGAVRTDDLLQKLNEVQPHVIQFSGHGDTATIFVVDGDGNAKPVASTALVKVFKSVPSQLKLIVFNTCKSNDLATAALEVVPVAVGMAREIDDDAARIFAAAFYRAVAFGHSVQVAFDQGVAALALEAHTDEDVPQLFVRPGVDASALILINPQ